MKNKLKGGKADNKSLSSFSSKELNMGAKEESEEHTKDKSIAKEIAADHLTEDPKYYSKQKKMDKVEVRMPDGSIKRAPGKELLEKEPSLLKSRWADIKDALHKAVVSNSTIPEMSKLMSDQSEAQPQGEEQQEAQEPDEGQEAPGGDEDTQGQAPQESLPEEQAANNAPDEEEQQDMTDEDLIEAMKEEGYSDQEIGFILWGHAPTTDSIGTIQDHAHEMAHQDPQDPKHDEDNREHAKDHMKAMRELELSHAKAKDPTPDLEMMRSHKKEMLQMERDRAKKMMEMELKHKEHELAAKRLEMAQKLKEKPTQVKSTKDGDSK